MFEKEVLEVLKSINENLVKLLVAQEKTSKITKHWNADGVPPKVD